MNPSKNPPGVAFRNSLVPSAVLSGRNHPEVMSGNFPETLSENSQGVPCGNPAVVPSQNPADVLSISFPEFLGETL